MTDLALGKRPATHDDRDLRFAAYRIGALPRRPRTFGHEAITGSWDTLGNDQYGDCVFAGACHETMVWTAIADRQARFSDATALMDYSAVTGFKYDDPTTDQGTYTRDALKYRQQTGIRDIDGTRHQIGAYVALDPKDLNHILEALYLFGAVGIGVEFPQSAFDQFNKGKPWSVVKGSPIEGGHYVPLVAERWHLQCVTWGRLVDVSAAWLKTYADEAWAFISPEMLKSGKSPEGFDLAALTADLNALKGA